MPSSCITGLKLKRPSPLFVFPPLPSKHEVLSVNTPKAIAKKAKHECPKIFTSQTSNKNKLHQEKHTQTTQNHPDPPLKTQTCKKQLQKDCLLEKQSGETTKTAQQRVKQTGHSDSSQHCTVSKKRRRVPGEKARAKIAAPWTWRQLHSLLRRITAQDQGNELNHLTSGDNMPQHWKTPN